MRTILMVVCVLCTTVLPSDGVASAGPHDSAPAPSAAPATQPAAKEDLDLLPAAREPELVRTLKEAEERTGMRRIGYDADGKIRTLYLSSSMATDENIRAIPTIPDVNYVRISGSWSGISADALAELRHVPHLEKLEMRYASRQISLDYGMALAQISSLRALSLSRCDIDPNAIGLLSALPHLTTLELHATRDLTDANIVTLTNLKQLEELDLSHTSISDASLNVLATLPHLKRLNVTGTRITEEGVLSSTLAGKVAVKGAIFKTVSPPAPS